MYKVTMQYAHHSHDGAEVLCDDGRQDVITYFDRVDWRSEAVRANKLQNVSPTISFESKDSRKQIWVSIYGEEESIKFACECCMSHEVSSMFGLKKRQQLVSLDVQALSIQEARQAVEHFLNNETDALQALCNKTKAA